MGRGGWAVGAVVAMKPAFGKIGYTIGLIIYVLLLKIYIREEWFADAEARGLSDQQAQHALNVVQHASVGKPPSVVGYDPKMIERIAPFRFPCRILGHGI